MDSENLAAFHEAIDNINTTHVHDVHLALEQHEIDDLAEELLSIRTAQDYLTKRREELRKMVFEGMDIVEGNVLSSPIADTKVVRQIRGNNAYLDTDKIRATIPYYAESIIMRDIVSVGIDEDYLHELLDDGLVTQDQIRQCFSFTPTTPALTFEELED